MHEEEGGSGHAEVRARAPLGAAYRWLWTSSTSSNVADGLFHVALPLAAIRLTRSPALISGLTVAPTLPWLLFALLACPQSPCRAGAGPR